MDAQTPCLSLEGELTIQTAAEQRIVLLDAISRSGADDLVIDLAEVHGCDSAGVQLLLAARRQLQRNGRRMHVRATSKVVRDVLSTYGVRSLTAAAGPVQSQA